MMSGSENAGTRRRVKLYVLNEDRQWDDRGTGHVSAMHSDKHKGNALIVISEIDGTCLLESKILSDTAYQKQQETLIVWSEGENNDLALSFQEKMGCDEIWEKICSVQGKDPSVDITQDVNDNESDEADDAESETCTVSSSAGSMELPPCELSRLEDLLEIVAQASTSIIKRDRLATTLERGTYIKELVAIFHKAEDLEDMDALHHLYEIVRHIISFNKHGLYDVLFSDELILDIVGILEYDPSLMPSKANHREFLKSKSHFREVLPMHNPELKARIHQTYRVQYIQECCLPPPSLFEENMVSSLSSFIFFNKIEIVTALQEDEKMMRHLFNQMIDDDADDHRRQELALFLKELCSLSTTMQAAARDNFFRSLCSFGALRALELLLTLDDSVSRGAALSILNHFLDCTPGLLRDFIMREASDGRNDEELFINILVDHMLNDEDPELGSALQISYMIRALTDPESMASSTISYTCAIFQRNEKTEFLNFFYKRCMPYLVEPFMTNVTEEDSLKRDDYRTALLISYIFELLSFCVEHHSHCIKNFFMAKDVVRRAMVHVASNHRFLVLGAIRFLRKLVGMKEEFYHRFIIKHNLFRYVTPLFRKNKHRYNLIDSALIELFEHILAEDIRPLILHVVDTHWEHLSDINYVSTFRSLLARRDQVVLMKSGEVNPAGPTSGAGALLVNVPAPALSAGPGEPALRRGGSSGLHSVPRPPLTSAAIAAAAAHPEDEEEMWLEEEEEEEEPPPTFAGTGERIKLPVLTGEDDPVTARSVSSFRGMPADETSIEEAPSSAKSSADEPAPEPEVVPSAEESGVKACKRAAPDDSTTEEECADNSSAPRTLGLVDYSSDEEEEEDDEHSDSTGVTPAPSGQIGPRLLPLETGDAKDGSEPPCRKRLRLDSTEEGADEPAS